MQVLRDCIESQLTKNIDHHRDMKYDFLVLKMNILEIAFNNSDFIYIYRILWLWPYITFLQ